MSSDPLADILAWSLNQPEWQRDALRRLFAAGSLSAKDLDDLLELCKAKHGLGEPRTPDPLTKNHLAVKEGDTAPVSLVKLTHHHGVNALAPEQAVTLGPQLTIVYGQNAAGKSGYARVLKRACRSRFAEDILGNVLATGAPLKAHATIEFRVGTTEHQAEWHPDAAPAAALAAVSVFDAQCAPVYIRDKTDVAFRPFSLDVLDKLSGACGELRKRLEAERNELNRAPVALPTVGTGTRVAAVLGGLTSLTKLEDIQILATFSEDDEQRLKTLRAQRRDLEAGDPTKRAQELELKASRVERLAKHLEKIVSLFGNGTLEQMTESRAQLTAARATLAHLRETVLTADLLPGTGQESWRKMWDAAANYSPHAYPGVEFPVLSDGARCLLCQQPLDSDAATRLRHFQDLVSSTAQRDVRAAEQAYEKHVSAVRDITIEGTDVTLALEEVAVDDTDASTAARRLLAAAVQVKQAILTATASEASLLVHGLQSGPEERLQAAARQLRDRATQLRKETPAMDPKDVAALAELEARATLKERLDNVLQEIERKKRIAAYGQCIDDTNTATITRKSTELTTALITKRLQDQFQRELTRLEFTHLSVEIKSAGGTRGAQYHHLVFTNAPGVVVAQVLSEGESRALSLAAFLTELSTAASPSAIIFDDPVSSLDHIWRERIARRLVEEAKSRQVIVFTHDLVFLRLLMKECENSTIKAQHQYVRRDGSGAGMCSPELPWVAMPLRDRIGRLRVLWQAADKISRTTGADAYEKEAREIYGMLREAWEQAVEEVLLNDVIERYRHSIETKKLRQLHDITQEDCTAVEAGMTECSRWIRGHDHPAANGAPFPKPADLKQRIDDLDSWSQAVRKRREGKKKSGA